jgi:hypothetical protein
MKSRVKSSSDWRIFAIDYTYLCRFILSSGGAEMTTKDSAQDPKEVTVSEGLAKVHEASDQLTEEEIEALAEEARLAATQTKKVSGNAP